MRKKRTKNRRKGIHNTIHIGPSISASGGTFYPISEGDVQEIAKTALTIISEIGLAQVDTFGFKLDEKYEDELVLIDVEDRYEEMFYILTYQIKDSHINVIRDLFKKNIKYVTKDIRDLGNIKHYSRNVNDINVYADCIVLSEFDNLPSRKNYWLDICLWDKYLGVYYKYIY